LGGTPGVRIKGQELRIKIQKKDRSKKSQSNKRVKAQNERKQDL
jgi:hypothetical protein